jgi:hypothetical protein
MATDKRAGKYRKMINEEKMNELISDVQGI